MGNLWCQNTKQRNSTTARDVSAFEAGNEVSSSVVVEMSSRRLSSEDPVSRKVDNNDKDETNIDQEPSIISRLFMMWVLPFVYRSYFSPLRGHEMPRLRSELRSKRRLREAKAMWDNMVEHWKLGTGPRPSLYRMIWRMNRGWCIWGLLLGFLQGILNNAAKPILLNLMILAFSEKQKDLNIMILLLSLGITVLIEGWCKVVTQTILHTDLCTKSIAWVVPLIQRKATRISAFEQDNDDEKENNDDDNQENLTSSEVSLIGNDCIRSFELAKYAFEIPKMIVGLVSGIAALVILLGYPSIIGLLTMALALILNRIAAKKSKPVSEKDLQSADLRLSSMREIIESITQVKFMCWEQQYMELLTQLRNAECRWILLYRLLIVVSLTVGRASPILASCATFVYMGIQGTLEANTVFAALAAYNALRLPLIALPLELVILSTLDVSHERILSYLLAPEFEGEMKNDRVAEKVVSGAAVIPMVVTNENEEKKNDDSNFVSCVNCEFSWKNSSNEREKKQDDFRLRNINFHVAKGELVGIIGRVGCGKSSLLLSIFKSTHKIRGSLYVNTKSSIAYVPQVPFIFSGTVLSNIVLDRPVRQSALKNAITAAAMDRDLTLMPFGLQTVIGERGVTLSGGQKMRLAIARAVYEDPEFLILDDALAAVDGHVALRIWHNVCEHRRKKGLTTLMSLNQRQFIPLFDRYVELKDGRIVREVANTKTLEGKEDEVEKKVKESKCTDDEIHPVMKTKDDLISEETRRLGALDMSAFTFFFKRVGGWKYALSVVTLGILAYGLFAATDLWLAAWVAQDGSFGGNMSDTSRAIGYISLSLGHAFLVLTLSSWDAYSINEACKAIHGDCLDKLLKAPSSWYQSTPSGRIMSRFSSDLSLIDHMFSDTWDNWIQFTFIMIALVCVTSMIVPEMVPIFFVGALLYTLSVSAVRRANREAKRETNNAQSPMLSTMAETVNGRLLIRVMKFERFFLARQLEHVDSWNRFNYFAQSTVVFQDFVTAILGFIFSVSTAFLIFINVKYNDFNDVAMIGISLNYTYVLPYFLGIYSGFIMSMTYLFTSLERFAEYASSNMPQEPTWKLEDDPDSTEWPSKGEVRFENVCMRYRKNLPLVLKNVNFTIQAGLRVAVVGRTGAGKSSLVSLLFRLTETAEGKVFLDGRRHDSVGLHTLRQSVFVLPQTPLLFPGSIGHNLDPFHRKSSQELLSVLCEVGLATSNDTASRLERNCSDLSVGQLQLIALARLLLVKKQVKIILMDEPTANIDVKTDAEIQRLITESFEGITMITIAHRLDTIISYDRVLVMDAGRVVEYGTPHEILQVSSGHFSSMVDALGSDVSNSLREEAKRCADARKKVV